MSKEESFSVGDEVMVRWEGSRKYFKAKVTRTLKTQNVHVKFVDGTEKTVPIKDLKALEEPSSRRSSRSRKATPSPEKKPRRRSTSRGRSKSPTRSPSKAKKPVATPPSPRRRGRPTAIKSTQLSPEGGLSGAFQLKELAIPLEKVILSPVEKEPRYPSRRKIIDENITSSTKKEFEPEKVRPVTISAPTPSAKSPRGGAFFALLMMVLMSTLPPFLYLACNKNKAVLFGVPPIPKRLSSYLTLKSAGIFLAWVAFQFVLTFVLPGRKVKRLDDAEMHHRMNGLPSVVSTAVAVAATAYYRLLPLNYFWENQLRLTSCAVLFSLLMAVFLYAKSFYHPGRFASNTGNYLYDFYLGRELNPRLWGTFDLKFLLFRLGFTSWALVNSLLLYKYFGVHGCISYPLASTAAMQLLYILDTFWREEVMLGTSTFLYDGLGCAFTLAFGAILPFVCSLPVLYLTSGAQAPQNQPPWLLALSALAFFVGLVLVRKSLMDKYAFKRNPFNPALAHLKMIPPEYTRCIIASGVWGVVRHPNYLGEILMFLAWTIPCGFDSPLPYVPATTTFLGLIVRSLLQESAAKRRHGQAWLQYTLRVRYRIFPGIF